MHPDTLPANGLNQLNWYVHVHSFLKVTYGTSIAVFVLFLRMGYLDKRLDGFQELIDDKFPQESPVIFLIDNINMYRGKARHDRLLKKLGPKMWNFTARAALFPCLDGIEDLFLHPTKWMEPQSPVEDLKAKEILLGMYASFCCNITVGVL